MFVNEKKLWFFFSCCFPSRGRGRRLCIVSNARQYLASIHSPSMRECDNLGAEQTEPAQEGFLEGQVVAKWICLMSLRAVGNFIAQERAKSQALVPKSLLCFPGGPSLHKYLPAGKYILHNNRADTYPCLNVNGDKHPAQHNHQNQGLKPKKRRSQTRRRLSPHYCLQGPQLLQNNNLAFSL